MARSQACRAQHALASRTVTAALGPAEHTFRAVALLARTRSTCLTEFVFLSALLASPEVDPVTSAASARLRLLRHLRTQSPLQLPLLLSRSAVAATQQASQPVLALAPFRTAFSVNGMREPQSPTRAAFARTPGTCFPAEPALRPALLAPHPTDLAHFHAHAFPTLPDVISCLLPATPKPPPRSKAQPSMLWDSPASPFWLCLGLCGASRGGAFSVFWRVSSRSPLAKRLLLKHL